MGLICIDSLRENTNGTGQSEQQTETPAPLNPKGAAPQHTFVSDGPWPQLDRLCVVRHPATIETIPSVLEFLRVSNRLSAGKGQIEGQSEPTNQ